MTEPAMIISMPTIARSQQRYDHRLRNLVQRTGDVILATDMGVPSSTGRRWLDSPSARTIIHRRNDLILGSVHSNNINNRISTVFANRIVHRENCDPTNRGL